MQLSVVAKEDEGPKALNFLEDVAGRVRSLPGVEAVAFSNGLPFAGAVEQWLTVEGKQNSSGEPLGLMAVQYLTTPDYFRALGVGLVRGRSSPRGQADAQLVPSSTSGWPRRCSPARRPSASAFKTRRRGALRDRRRRRARQALRLEARCRRSAVLHPALTGARKVPAAQVGASRSSRGRRATRRARPAVRQQVLAADPNSRSTTRGRWNRSSRHRRRHGASR